MASSSPIAMTPKRRFEVRANAGQAAQGGVNILGPECAVPLTTPTGNLQAIIEAAKELA